MHQQSRWTATPCRLIGAPTSIIPTIFTPDALPYTTLPIYPGLAQAPNMLACIPGDLVYITMLLNQDLADLWYLICWPQPQYGRADIASLMANSNILSTSRISCLYAALCSCLVAPHNCAVCQIAKLCCTANAFSALMMMGWLGGRMGIRPVNN